jgi:hypothetical protein
MVETPAGRGGGKVRVRGRITGGEIVAGNIQQKALCGRWGEWGGGGDNIGKKESKKENKKRSKVKNKNPLKFSVRIWNNWAEGVEKEIERKYVEDDWKKKEGET